MPNHSDKRASPRVPARIAVHVVGRDIRHSPIDENSETLLINENGALIALAAELQLQDRIRITNQASKGTIDARIAWRSSTQIGGRWSYGVALLNPPEDFWEMKKPA